MTEYPYPWYDHTTFICDECELTLDVNSRKFKDVNRERAAHGWSARQVNGAWHHYCSRCTRIREGRYQANYSAPPGDFERGGHGRKRKDYRENHHAPAPSTTRAWMNVLGLAPPVTIVELRRAHKKLALTNHPDRGGSLARMQEINNARDEGLRELR